MNSVRRPFDQTGGFIRTLFASAEEMVASVNPKGQPIQARR
jgi:hypothetical protein